MFYQYEVPTFCKSEEILQPTVYNTSVSNVNQYNCNYNLIGQLILVLRFAGPVIYPICVSLYF